MTPERFKELQEEVHVAMRLWMSIGRLQGVTAWGLSSYIEELERLLAESEESAYMWSNRLTRVEAVTSAPAPDSLDAYSQWIWIAAMRAVNEAMEEGK